MKVSFSTDDAVVEDETGKCILRARKDESSELFIVQCQISFVSVLFPKHSSVNDKVAFYFACMGSPTSSTLLNALHNKGLISLVSLPT
jgi:hypothetical protein